MTRSSSLARSVLIVGGGFAGAVLALRLLEEARSPLAIHVIEEREEIGRGVAYSTREPVHLVNAPARVFSVDERDPEHFARWLATNRPDLPQDPGGFAETFVPRWLYGTYVGDVLRNAAITSRPGVELRHARSRAVKLERARDGFVATLADGTRLEADEAVLALGVFPKAPERSEAGAAGREGFVRDPWNPASLDHAAAARDVLLIGNSLSMVDVVASLETRGFRGRILAISRRGHLVEARGEAEACEDFLDDADLPRTALALLRRVQAARRAIERDGGDWRSLLPTLRPRVAALWRGASTAERLRFARHLRALWDVTLHQAAPPSRRWLEGAERDRRFESAAARLLDLDHADGRFRARLRRRGTFDTEIREFDAVIDCRGSQEHDWRRIADPFVRQLLETGLVRPHATGYGIDAAADGSVIGRDGRVVPGLHAIGHPLRGAAWESSSIPEQLAQASALRDRLLRSETAIQAAE